MSFTLTFPPPVCLGVCVLFKFSLSCLLPFVFAFGVVLVLVLFLFHVCTSLFSFYLDLLFSFLLTAMQAMHICVIQLIPLLLLLLLLRPWPPPPSTASTLSGMTTLSALYQAVLPLPPKTPACWRLRQAAVVLLVASTEGAPVWSCGARRQGNGLWEPLLRVVFAPACEQTAHTHD